MDRAGLHLVVVLSPSCGDERHWSATKRHISPAQDKAEAKAEAKGRAMLAGRRVPKIAHARLAQISKGYLCMAALQQKQFAVG